MTQSLKSVNVITLFVEDPLRSKEFYERIFDVVGVDEGHGTVIFPFDRPWGRRNAAFADPDGHVWQFGSDIPSLSA